jgi:hypothetical protein
LFWNVNTEAVDAFSQNWYGENNWLVPSIYAIIRTVTHLVAYKAKGNLIIPKWTLIFSKHWSYHSYVKDTIEFKNTTCIYVKGTNCNSIFGTKPFIAPVVAVLLDAN